ncbi:MAG: fluoride efflux transporter CrcB, partial [Acidobacteriota bacterium]|nr:fluoride efflux transporter CrcB [Acidobacteriota bacterium]
ICLGGAAGAGTRYLVSVWAAERFGGPFPLGTLLVNLAGCFLLGLIMHATLTVAWSPTLRAAVTVGFLGGLTTYSSFNHETTSLLQHGAAGLGALNALVTVVGSFVAGWLGLIVSRFLVGP